MTSKLLLMVGALAFSSLVNAELKYSTTLTMGSWTGNRNLDDKGGEAVATFHQTLKLDRADFRFEADLLAMSKDSSEKSNLTARELFVQHRSEDLVVKLGRQIINWGKTDLINPTQRFASTNYRLRSSQPGMQQGGVDALRITRTFDQFNLEAVGALFEGGSQIPLGPLQRAGLMPQDKSESTNKAFGLRFSNADVVHEYSISYFRGNDVMPIYSLGRDWLARPVHPLLESIGGDYAYNVGRYSFKTEAAFTRNLDRSKTFLPLDQLHWVAGVEQKLADYSLSILYSQKWVKNLNSALLNDPISRFNLSATDQLSDSPRDILIRVTRIFDDLDGNLTIIFRRSLNSSSGGFVVHYEKGLADSISLMLGIDHFFGTGNTYAGALRKNSLGFAVVKLSF